MKKKMTNVDLRRKVAELESQLVHLHHFADATISKAGTSHMMGSGVIVSLTALGGRQIIEPIMIRDGLSDETIAALRADIVRSYATATAFKPKGA